MLLASYYIRGFTYHFTREQICSNGSGVAVAVRRGCGMTGLRYGGVACIGIAGVGVVWWLQGMAVLLDMESCNGTVIQRLY